MQLRTNIKTCQKVKGLTKEPPCGRYQYHSHPLENIIKSGKW